MRSHRLFRCCRARDLWQRAFSCDESEAGALTTCSYKFITTHRELIVARTREKVASRTAPRPTEVEIVHGVPLFLDQLSARLRTNIEPGASQIGASASLHGGELLVAGFTIGQVVHDYGNICQAITELAVELESQITNEDFRMLNLCLDIAIADAVTEYARQREQAIVGQGVEHLGFLAHELRNLLNTATLAFEAVRSGSVGVGGSTGSLLGKSLVGMRDLVNRSLAEVRLEAGPPRDERILVASLLEEIEIAATMQAKSRDVQLSIEPPESGVSGRWRLPDSRVDRHQPRAERVQVHARHTATSRCVRA